MGLLRRGAVVVVVAACMAAGGAPATDAESEAGTDSLFTVSIAGPAESTIPANTAPPRFDYTITVAYVGPAIAPGGQPVNADLTMTLGALVQNPGIDGTFPGTCDAGPPQGTPGASWTCHFAIGPGAATTFSYPLGVRPTGKTGSSTTTVSLSTGAQASWTTTFVAEAVTTTTIPTTTQQTTTSSAPTQAAAPTSLSEQFTSSTPPQAEAVTVSPAADAVTVGLTWPSSSDSFDVTGVTIVRNGQVVARAPASATVRRLVVVKTRKATSLKVAIKNPVRGKLRFKIVARKVHKATRVRATIRQTKTP
jgi:hypothetical protein